MRSQNTNHASVQSKTKQNSCNHKAPIMQACNSKIQGQYQQITEINQISIIWISRTVFWYVCILNFDWIKEVPSEFACFLSVCMFSVDRIKEASMYLHGLCWSVCMLIFASFASLDCMINLDHFACVSLNRLHGFDRMSLKKWKYSIHYLAKFKLIKSQIYDIIVYYLNLY